MKSTGIVRRIDDLGRVVLPMELRRTLGIKDRDPIEIHVGDNGEVILTKYVEGARCPSCGRGKG